MSSNFPKSFHHPLGLPKKNKQTKKTVDWKHVLYFCQFGPPQKKTSLEKEIYNVIIVV